jgi:ParB family chromosome partitioning protein
MENKKRALGRGLEQLFNSDNLNIETIEKQIYDDATNEEILEISLDELRPNPYQPRKVFNEESLKELSDSIKEHGVFQPIIVKKSIHGYEIIAGERRYRASKMAGIKKIPAIIRTFTDEQMMEIALLENLQRENLSAIEEAQAYKSMLEKLNLTQEQLSKKVGKSRSHITNLLGLLRLPSEIQAMVNNGVLTMGHARALSKLESDEQIVTMANEIAKNKLPVRDIEQMVKEEDVEKKNKIKRHSYTTDSNYRYVEDIMAEKLDTKVKIKDKKIEIKFTNVADLNRILEILKIKG